jgi:hypothetical protein
MPRVLVFVLIALLGVAGCGPADKPPPADDPSAIPPSRGSGAPVPAPAP